MGQAAGRETNKSAGRVVQARSSIVPSQKGSDQTQSTTDPGNNVSGGQVGQVSGGEEEEGEDEDEEHGGHGDGGTEGSDPHDEGENSPGEEEDSEGVVQGVVRGVCVGGDDAETRDKNHCV